LADYTAVITAETAALTDALTALQVRSSRATASVALIQDLGGGWNRSDLPGPDWIADATSPTTTTEREPQ
jgi:outer membrane protein TolC